MLKIICTNSACNKEIYFNSKDDLPKECEFCWEVLPNDIEILEMKIENNVVISLSITYQKNQESLLIPIDKKIILGREHFGSELLSKIVFNGNLVISRKHCSIEYKNGSLYLLDEGSLNGTFYSINKINCKNEPIEITDNNIFYLGQEPFLLKVNYSLLENVISEPVTETTIEDIKTFNCRKCGNIFSEKLSECPVCEGYKTID